MSASPCSLLLILDESVADVSHVVRRSRLLVSPYHQQTTIGPRNGGKIDSRAAPAINPLFNATRIPEVPINLLKGSSWSILKQEFLNPRSIHSYYL